MPDAGGVEALVDRMVDTAVAEWPDLGIERAAFRAHLVTVLGRDPEALDAASTVRVGDLYLAYGCCLGRPAAVKAFATRYLPRVRDYVRRFERVVVSADEVRRELEDILLLGRNGSGPRLAAYRGRGPLEHFVAAAARNVARTLLRRDGRISMRYADDPDAEAAPPGRGSKDFVASRYKAVIRDAVRIALRSLDRRQRMIVRLHLSRGVTLTHIARMLQVHQSTVSRALEGALEHLHSEIRRQLREVHGLSDTEMKSIVRDVRSMVDLSLSRILQDTQADR
jgi:RNA polymerase sigma-70 factor